MTYTMTRNPQFNSLEIAFDGKPSEAIREALKELKFRWHGVKKVWYGYADEAAAKAAIEGKKVAKAEKAPKAEKKNKFGVKVGDIFYTSWGYEQTQTDFFQVVALAGETSVRVRQVDLPIVASQATGPMSENRVYKIVRDLLPASSHSVFIEDQEKGDLKRLKSYRQDGTEPQFNLTSYANAYLVTGDEMKAYESWYY